MTSPTQAALGTVYVVVCAAYRGDVWVHGVYASRAMAKRVFRRLSDETYDNVRMQPMRVRRQRKTSHD